MVALYTLLQALPAAGQPTQAPGQVNPPPNQSTRRYEVNQTFDGRSFLKDNNVWVVTKEFADLFGMPASFIDDVQGVAAAAFRIEDTSYQTCGMGGRVDACYREQQCLLDLYFDEAKTPLPWATDIKSYWVPHNSSMRWLRSPDPKERPHGMLAVDPAPGVLRNEVLHSAIIPFADPTTKRQAIFTTNSKIEDGHAESVSGSMAIFGYTRNFYRAISVVSLQFGCTRPNRHEVDIRLDARKEVADEPIAKFNRVRLPARFIQRMGAAIRSNSDRNAMFYRSLFTPPAGTPSPAPAAPATR